MYTTDLNLPEKLCISTLAAVLPLGRFQVDRQVYGSWPGPTFRFSGFRIVQTIKTESLLASNLQEFRETYKASGTNSKFAPIVLN